MQRHIAHHIYPILGNSRRKGSSSGRRADTDMSSDRQMSTNDIDGLAAAGPGVPMAMRCATLSTADVLPRSARLVVGTSSTEWLSLPSSLRLALDGQAVPRRKGLAAEIPG